MYFVCIHFIQNCTINYSGVVSPPARHKRVKKKDDDENPRLKRILNKGIEKKRWELEEKQRWLVDTRMGSRMEKSDINIAVATTRAPEGVPMTTSTNAPSGSSIAFSSSPPVVSPIMLPKVMTSI